MDDERAFLARTVWRVGLDRLARNGGKAMRFAEDVADLELASADESPEQQAVDAAQRTLLRKLIDGLGDDLRIPLVLCAIEGMTSAQVAVTLGIPEGTIRTRLMRARTELKRRFAATQPRKETRR
jgi:RNA polymerase sigma-70 factor (ECF subfamily)